MSVDYQAVRSAANQAVETFSDNRVFAALDAGRWGVTEYRNLLLTLYYQVYQVSVSFAAAAANCPRHFVALRAFLSEQAEQDSPHYRWITHDLHSIGYRGPDPKLLMPPPSTMAYLAFNLHNAQSMPGTPLSSAIVLDGIARRYGRAFGSRVLDATRLGRDKLTFLLSYGEAGDEQGERLWETLERSPLSADEVRWQAHSANVAGTFYKRMWDESLDYVGQD